MGPPKFEKTTGIFEKISGPGNQAVGCGLGAVG